MQVTLKNFFIDIATYEANIPIQLQIILASFLGQVGGGRWPWDEAKTMLLQHLHNAGSY